jgi:hypothetical protein
MSFSITIRLIQLQLPVLSWSISLNMVFFSLEKVLHHVEVTLYLNIELSEVIPLKGKGFRREERWIGGDEWIDPWAGRKD